MEISDWLPMLPWEGPPLPRWTGAYWPWVQAGASRAGATSRALVSAPSHFFTGPQDLEPRASARQVKLLRNADGYVEEMQLVTLDDMAVELRKMNRYFAKTVYEGRQDNRNLAATEQTQVIDAIQSFPYSPWISGIFYNKGLKSVFVSFNDDQDYKEIIPGETSDRDYSLADRRIERMYYKCNPGETSTLRLEGKY